MMTLFEALLSLISSTLGQPCPELLIRLIRVTRLSTDLPIARSSQSTWNMEALLVETPNLFLSSLGTSTYTPAN